MTVYLPKGRHTGAAVVVFPGGGYKVLAIDLEGTEVCDWLTSKGIPCVLLQYRVPFSGPYWDDGLKRHINPRPLALEDAAGNPIRLPCPRDSSIDKRYPLGLADLAVRKDTGPSST